MKKALCVLAAMILALCSSCAAEGNGTGGRTFLSDGILNGMEAEQVSGDGFTAGYPTGERQRSDRSGGLLVRSEYRDGEKCLVFEARLFLLNKVIPGGYAGDPEKARGLLETLIRTGSDPGVSGYEKTLTEIDGHPAMAERYEYRGDGLLTRSIGRLWYPRNDRMLRVSLISVPKDSTRPEEPLKVTMADVTALASGILYNEDDAPLSAKNAAVTVTARGNPATVTAGKSIQFEAGFADTDRINRKAKNDGITWSVVNAETGEATAAAAISDGGRLTADRTAGTVIPLEVRATSEIFGTEGTYRVDVLPVIRSVTVEPAELFFYTGSDESRTVKVTLDPAIAPRGISWTPERKGVAEIRAEEDGTATVRPLAAGKTGVEVREPGGRSGRLTVNVTDPVTGVKLTAKGTARPGASMAIIAETEPAKAGNRAVEWSLGTGGDIAAISDKGKLTISREAPAGAKITVVCRALGAPEAVTATLEIEVSGK